LRSAYFTAGFRGAHRDAALREVVQPPLCSGQLDDERDSDPCPPEDEELFEVPDAESMEEAISKFVDGLESQEHSGFDNIHRLIQRLPVPVTKANRTMTHAQAIEAQFLPDMTEEEQKRFTVKEVFDSMYTEYIPAYTRYIQLYP
jgi:hypothetical protein